MSPCAYDQITSRYFAGYLNTKWIDHLEHCNKKRVLFIGPYPPPYSGPEMGMKLFLESSLRQDYRISFLNTNVRNTNVTKGKLDLVVVLAFFRFIAALVYMLIRHRPVLAYYPVTPTELGWLGRDLWCILICRLFRVKTVIHLRGSHFRPNFSQFSAFGKRLVRSGCAMVSAAIVQADCLREQFEGLVPKERIKTLYQAIDSTEYHNPDLSNYQRGKILFVGNMTKAKGYCDLVRAIAPVVKKHPEANFYFAGGLRKGERGVFFNQITGQQLAYEDPFVAHDEIMCGLYKNHYHALGVVGANEKVDLLRSSDIFVLPSYSEGFSRALLEAMCVGKPVICTAVGAHREVIQDKVHGLLVQPGDVAGLVDCICRLLEDRQLRDRIAHTNYRRVRADFDIAGIARQFSTILENCTNEH